MLLYNFDLDVKHEDLTSYTPLQLEIALLDNIINTLR